MHKISPSPPCPYVWQEEEEHCKVLNEVINVLPLPPSMTLDFERALWLGWLIEDPWLRVSHDTGTVAKG